MFIRSLTVTSAVVVLATTSMAIAGTNPPSVNAPYNSVYSIGTLGHPPSVPGSLGGLVFKDNNTLLIGGDANYAPGAIYQLTVTRDSGGHITGFAGPATLYATAPYIDGGLWWMPNGTLCYATYSGGSNAAPGNCIGQILPGGTSPASVTPMGPKGIVGTLGTGTIIPAGFPGAGRLVLGDYYWGDLYSAPFTANQNGTYTIGNATLECSTAPSYDGFEGIVYVDTGNPLFGQASVLVSDYFNYTVNRYRIDSNGIPIYNTREVVVQDLGGAEGGTVDPVTGEFLFSTYGSVSEVYVLLGFTDAGSNGNVGGGGGGGGGGTPPTPKLKLVASPTVKVNDTFTVNVDIADLARSAVGAQARVGFDPTKVDFVSFAGGTAFPLVIYNASTSNSVTFATGIMAGSGSGATSGNIAQLTFRAKTVLCGDAISAAFASSGFTNRVTDNAGQPITFTPEANVSVTSLSGFSITGAPALVSGKACDAGYLGAEVAAFTGAAPSASNSCGTSLNVSVQVTLPDTTTQNSIPARFPIGTSTVVWTASDAAGNTASETRTVQVDDRQVLTVAAAVTGTSAGNSTRLMNMTYSGGPSGGQSASIPMVNASGNASGSVDVDITPAIASGPACASIKDLAHSLRKTAAGFGTSGTKWTVDFGGLVQGDSNNDDLVDILDFGHYVGDYAGSAAPAARSNFDGDGDVDTADYTFISGNFFQMGVACSNAHHDAPRSSVTVKDLRRMGMGELAVADINRDGRVDQADIVAFMRGVRAGEATRDAGAASNGSAE